MECPALVKVSWQREVTPRLRVWRGVNTAMRMARVRQATLRIVAFLCAAAVVLGVAGREDFFLGTMWAIARWPVLIAVAIGTAVAVKNGRRGIALASAAVVLVGIVEWGMGRVRRAEPVAVASGKSLQVLSFNLLFKGGDPRASLKVLASADADVIALQEVTSAWEARLAEPMREEYPHQIWKAHPGTHGFGLLSKHPLGEPVYLDNDDGRGIAQCAEVRTAGNVFFCNVHLASPAKALWHRSPAGFVRNAEQRAHEWKRLDELVEAQATSPRRIIAGDLNTMPHDPLHRAITRSWVDAWEWASDGLLGATWPNLHQRTPVPLFRIDYVLVQGPVVPEETKVLPRSGSDHRPLQAQVRL